MKWSALRSEARRNLASGTARAIGFAVVLLLLAGLTVGADALAVRSVDLRQRAVLDGGGATIRISATGSIDARRCVALSGVTGIRGSVALRSLEQRFPLATLPGSPPAQYEVAGDILAVLGGERGDSGGILLSSQLSDQLHTELGDVLPVTTQPDGGRVSGFFRYPDDGRATVLSAAVLQPVPAAGEFDECWVAVWPADATTEALAATAVETGTASTEITTSRLNPTFGTPVTTSQALAARASLHLPLMAGVLAAVLGFLAVRMRRVELALARHLGQTRRAQSLQMVIEAFAWSVPPLAACGAAILLVASRDLAGAEAAFLASKSMMNLAGVALALLAGVLTATLTISPRRMYRWSKDR